MSNSNADALAVGIDLGTTHCALSALDGPTGQAVHPGTAWAVPQVTHAGEVAAEPLLPSFLYLPGEHELPQGAIALPWDPDRAFVVGAFARDQGARVPLRSVSSAKSWLSHAGVDRRAEILPFEAPAEVAKLSPLSASARYLSHLREAWNASHPAQPLEAQHLVLTVPASFDAVARELTVEAAAQAGLGQLTLLEEPQAALYAWLDSRGEAWRKELDEGDVILVCDVGGGTSDFSLIAVVSDAGNLALERVAVGDHLLLGGDNMDLALAHAVRGQLQSQGKSIDDAQFRALTHAVRTAKEALFADPTLASAPLTLAGRGSALLGGTIRTELSRQTLTDLLVDGFFPRVEASATPQAPRRMGLTQLGLPYAQDAAITRHLAAFLSRHPQRPTAVLFNGGVFKAGPLQARVVEVLGSWMSSEDAPSVRVLPGADLDLAVARGAAAYARVRRGAGIRIRGGIARSYYVGVESAAPAVPGIPPPLKAVCVAPFGMEEGTDAALAGHELGLVVGEPVQFRFFASARRGEDAVGTVLDRWTGDELEELAPIEATLAPGEGIALGQVVPVTLHAEVTAVGTLALSAAPSRLGDTSVRWKLEFNVRMQGT